MRKRRNLCKILQRTAPCFRPVHYLYTASYLMFHFNFGKCEPLLKLFSPQDSWGKAYCLRTVLKIPTSPAIRCYTTSWTMKIKNATYFVVNHMELLPCTVNKVWPNITFGKYERILKIFQPTDSQGNFQCELFKDFQLTCTVLLYCEISKRITSFLFVFFITLQNHKYHSQQRRQHFIWCSLSVKSIVNCYKYLPLSQM